MASVLAIAVVPMILLTPFAALNGIQVTDEQEFVRYATYDPQAIAVQLLGALPAHLLTFLLAWVVVTGFRRRPFLSSLGWSAANVKAWHYIVIAIGFFAFVAVVFSIFPQQEDEMTRIIRSSRYALYIVSVIAVFSAPFVEEVVYRGVVYSAFLKRFGPGVAIAVATVLFTLVHIPQYYQNPAKIIVLLLLSFVLTILRTWSGGILPSVILHTIVNATQIAILLAEPFLDIPSPAGESTGF